MDKGIEILKKAADLNNPGALNTLGWFEIVFYITKVFALNIGRFCLNSTNSTLLKNCKTFKFSSFTFLVSGTL